jgi:hypothetical protein
MNEQEKKTKRQLAKRNSGPIYADEEEAAPLHPGPHRERYLPRSQNSNDYLTEMFEYNLRDSSDASAKRKFRVKIPTRLLRYVVLVFLIVPLILFAHREGHIHDDKNHYKAEHFNKVDTQDILSHLLDKPGDDNYSSNNITQSGTGNQAKPAEAQTSDTTGSASKSSNTTMSTSNKGDGEHVAKPKTSQSKSSNERKRSLQQHLIQRRRRR